MWTNSALLLLVTGIVHGQYLPTWESLETRPLPNWYDEAKIGIFVHWGVYSVPSFGSEWFWYNWADNSQSVLDFMEKNYKPGFTYQDFARDFTAEFYEPEKWAELFQASGARYVVLTSKHHEGYTLWPSQYSYSWNAKDVGPHRDLLGDFVSAIRSKTNMTLGLYYSLYEWFNPLYMQDKANNFATNEFVQKRILPEITELIETFQPEVLWSDGDWEAPDWYWNSTNFLAWLYNSSPVKDSVVTNDRWGDGIMCNHGGFLTCTDRYNPGVLQSRKWENAMTIDRESWGFRRNAVLSDYFSYEDIVREVISTVSCGGNILINVGPTHDGMIAPVFEERLRSLGAWLGVNGEAVYSSKPWTFQNETIQTGVWYTKRQTYVYATILDWPKNNILVLKRPEIGLNNVINILGHPEEIKPSVSSSRAPGVTITLPDISKVNSPLPWVLRFSNVIN